MIIYRTRQRVQEKNQLYESVKGSISKSRNENPAYKDARTLFMEENSDGDRLN